MKPNLPVGRSPYKEYSKDTMYRKGGTRLKKLLLVYVVLISSFLLYFAYYHYSETSKSFWNPTDHRLQGEMSERYAMVTFQSGIDYWKNSLKGFEDAAQLLNVTVEYQGATQYDVHEEITVLEQIIAKKPAGIAVSAINPEALNVTIKKAIDAGIPVVLFDSDAPDSRALSFLGTNNYNAGVTAARKMAEFIGNKGKVAVISLPNQLNHQERYSGFRDTMEKDYKGIEVVALEDGKGDQIGSQMATFKVMQANPELAGIFATEANGGVGVGNAIKALGKLSQVKIISFDTDKGTLDMVRDGVISATLAQGTWNMGYWSLQHLFHIHHNLAQPVADWKEGNVPLLPKNVDTGISVVTESNVANYYAK
jgi:ribose transport system substrate-binding protein